MKHYTSIDWQQREGRFWTNFFNTASGARSAVLIGTKNTEGVSNLGLFNSLIHIGANPPLLGFILRPTTVPRHTYENILSHQEYTICHVTKSMVDEAHLTSAKFPENISEFGASGLKEEWLEGFQAPFVAESPIKLGLRFVQEHENVNGTRLIIGEVNHVMVNPDHILDNGSIDIAAQELISVSGLYRYHGLEFLKEKEYAKPSN